MEVTSTSSSQLTVKLGDIKSADITNDLFASHLADISKPDREPVDRNRRDARDVDDREPAKETASSRDEDDNNRVSDDEERADDASTSEEEANAQSSDAGAGSEAADAAEADLLKELEAALSETSETDDAGDGDLATLTNAGATDDTAATGEETDADAQVHATDQLAAETDATSQSEDELAIAAATEATAQADEREAEAPEPEDIMFSATEQNAATQQASQSAGSEAAQSAQRTAQARADAAQSATGEALASDGSADGELDLSLGDMSDGGENLAKGERGLGHQMAEAMSDKQNTTGAQKAAPAAGTAPTAAAPVTAPAAALTAATATSSLTTGTLSTDATLELLGQKSVTGAQTNLSPQNSNPVVARFGALPGQAQATQVPNTAIAMQIAKHVAKGVSTFEIRLDPPEMGRVDVKMEMAQDGRVTAHLSVEKSETLDLLQRDAKALEQALRDAGLDADADTLNFSLKQEGDGEQASAEQNDTMGDGDTDNGDNDLMSVLAARQIEAAARGGIDVSI